MNHPPINVNLAQLQAICRNGKRFAFNAKTFSVALAKARLADNGGDAGAPSPVRDVSAQHWMEV